MPITTYIIALISTLVSFLAIDAVWLIYSMKNFYQKYIGHILAETPNFVAAGFFYVIYCLGIVLLIIIPALEHGHSNLKVFITGAILGFMAYATYDLTNQATVTNWPTIVTVVDLIWGTILTGSVSVVAYMITKHFIS